MSIEKRSLQGNIELRSAEDSQAGLIGYAAVFGAPFEYWDIVETIDVEAFNSVLAKNSDIRALIDHDSSRVLARVGNKTLTLSVDQRGLKTDIVLNPGVSYVADLVENIRTQNIYGQSFAFSVKRDTVTIGVDEKRYRNILEFEEIYDVGPVTFPAYEATSIDLRSEKRSGTYELTRVAGEVVDQKFTPQRRYVDLARLFLTVKR